MEFRWVPEVGVPLLAIAVVSAYLIMMRALARVIDDRFDPLHDWREAEKRADTMLVEVLPAQDARRLAQKGYLEVASQKYPNRVYHIPKYQGPVSVYESGVLTNMLCVRSVEPIPNGDAIVMHKLMIEGDEDAYLKTANSIRPRPYSFSL